MRRGRFLAELSPTTAGSDRPTAAAPNSAAAVTASKAQRPSTLRVHRRLIGVMQSALYGQRGSARQSFFRLSISCLTRSISSRLASFVPHGGALFWVASAAA